jgi:hypothetical protein
MRIIRSKYTGLRRSGQRLGAFHHLFKWELEPACAPGNVQDAALACPFQAIDKMLSS